MSTDRIVLDWSPWFAAFALAASVLTPAHSQTVSAKDGKIFLDDIADVELPPGKKFTSIELLLTQENQSARTAAIKARERSLQLR